MRSVRVGCVVALVLVIAYFALTNYVTSRKMERKAEAAARARSEQADAADLKRRSALAEILSSPAPAPARTANLCEEWGSSLAPEHRQKCAAAHLSLAKEALTTKDFETARSMLSYSETEGGDLREIRRLRRQLPSTPRAAPEIAATSLREQNLNTIVRQLDPLFERWEFVGPVSVRMHLNVDAWNSMTYDQQRQLMDALASKAIVQQTKCTLHLYAHATKVGTIGPGWTGEWRFRRAE